MNADPVVMRYFPDTLSKEETLAILQRINAHFATHGFGLFAVEHTDTKEFLGFTGFSTPRFEAPFLPGVEIGWRFKKEAWGQGFATEAARACLQYGFETLKLQKILSFTSVINQPSIKVMQRIGMKYVEDFDHPLIAEDSELRKHVLYSVEEGLGEFRRTSN